MIGIFALLTGCVIESHSAVATGVSLQGVALQDASGNRIEAQQALVDHSGNGQGREVHARLTVDGPEGENKAEASETELTIDADRSEWNLADKIVVFEGNVRAERGTVHLQCRALEVSLDADGAIATALADGGVTVQQGQRKAKGDQAILNAKNGQLVLTGSPVVEEDGRSMRGGRITLWLDDDRMTCDDCTVVLDSPGINRDE